jgi:PIN domain nuclease of toxin-antitoxin system
VKYLLDTCTFLWAVAGSARVPPGVRRILADPANEVHVSAASAWEITVKHGLGKLPLPTRPDTFVRSQRTAHGFTTLALAEEHVLALAKLPALHRDPFDRMLVCQAVVEGLVVLTPDAEVTQYPIRAVWE